MLPPLISLRRNAFSCQFPTLPQSRSNAVWCIAASHQQQGFTLVELIAVMVMAGILAVAASQRLMSNHLQDLQAARDLTITCLHQAQQSAMAQEKDVRAILGSGSLDIRQDTNDDGNFSADESVTLGGTPYPLSLRTGVSITSHTLDFNRRGETSATNITLSKGPNTVTLSVSAMGFVR